MSGAVVLGSGLGVEWVAGAVEVDGVEGWSEVAGVVFDACLADLLAEVSCGFVALSGADVGEGLEDGFGEVVLALGEAGVGVFESNGVDVL